MTSIREYNKKLKSLKGTQKITQTMKMISAGKLRKAHLAQIMAKQYATAVTHLISRVALSVSPEAHPLFQTRSEVKNILILVITSDKGLCGAFNNNANKRVAAWIKDNEHRLKVDISCCGQKGYAFFQKIHRIKTYYENVTENPSFAEAKLIGQDLMDAFCHGEYEEVYIAYNQFFSPLSQKTLFEKILPIDPKALIHPQGLQSREYLFVPDTEQLLAFLIPHYLYFRVYFALLENLAGEHGARMTAMDNASRNTTELMDKYVLLRNRARQAAITTELTEIVAGAEALR